MFLQLPLTVMRTALLVTSLWRFAANLDKYNSAVRKAGSFEGTLPRCLSMRAAKSNWATLGDFFGFSVDSDLPTVDIPNTESPRLCCAIDDSELPGDDRLSLTEAGQG